MTDVVDLKAWSCLLLHVDCHDWGIVFPPVHLGKHRNVTLDKDTTVVSTFNFFSIFGIVQQPDKHSSGYY
jgi:hypothetical protein